MKTIILISALLLSTTSMGQGFNDRSEAVGLGAYAPAAGMGSGVSAADYDNDGDVDLFLPTASGEANRLFRNNGSGQFIDVAGSAGLADSRQARTALWLDVEGDGDLDLLVAGDCFEQNCNGQQLLRLYRQNSDHGFTEFTDSSGIQETNFNYPWISNSQHRAGLNAADIDNDGDLDIISMYWLGGAIIHRNNGDLTFTDISAQAGIEAFGPVGYWHVMPFDFNADGWMDIFVGVDFTENFLWLNQGDGTFVDIAPAAGIASAQNEMGAAFGDYDNDGDFDLYVTNIFAFYEPTDRNTLYRNDSVGGNVVFTEVSGPLGVADGSWGWGTTFLDYDQDGWLDLAATNGFFGDPWATDTTRLFHNQGGSGFTEVSAANGVNDSDWGHTLISADFDGDGDPDIVQTSKNQDGDGYLRYLENTQSIGNFLKVRPVDPADGTLVGAVVEVEADGLSQRRLISAGTSFLGQEPAEALFGVGSATTIDRVVVTWPDGTTAQRSDIAANQVLVIGQGQGQGAAFTGGQRVVPTNNRFALLVLALLLMLGALVQKRGSRHFS